jgi:small subunit ribosomal protein S18
MPRKNKPDRQRGGTTERRAPRPKPVVDLSLSDLDPKNVELLRKYVTDQGRILPRKYTGLPARYQRRLTRSIKRARQMLLMK